ncbi:unnamed protein product, partial [Amoebophrya sp. A25]|eukprot:GSA25T00016555001.1
MLGGDQGKSKQHHAAQGGSAGSTSIIKATGRDAGACSSSSSRPGAVGVTTRRRGPSRAEAVAAKLRGEAERAKPSRVDDLDNDASRGPQPARGAWSTQNTCKSMSSKCNSNKKTKPPDALLGPSRVGLSASGDGSVVWGPADADLIHVKPYRRYWFERPPRVPKLEYYDANGDLAFGVPDDKTLAALLTQEKGNRNCVWISRRRHRRRNKNRLALDHNGGHGRGNSENSQNVVAKGEKMQIFTELRIGTGLDVLSRGATRAAEGVVPDCTESQGRNGTCATGVAQEQTHGWQSKEGNPDNAHQEEPHVARPPEQLDFDHDADLHRELDYFVALKRQGITVEKWDEIRRCSAEETPAENNKESADSPWPPVPRIANSALKHRGGDLDEEEGILAVAGADSQHDKNFEGSHETPFMKCEHSSSSSSSLRDVSRTTTSSIAYGGSPFITWSTWTCCREDEGLHDHSSDPANMNAMSSPIDDVVEVIDADICAMLFSGVDEWEEENELSCAAFFDAPPDGSSNVPPGAWSGSQQRTYISSGHSTRRRGRSGRRNMTRTSTKEDSDIFVEQVTSSTSSTRAFFLDVAFVLALIFEGSHRAVMNEDGCEEKTSRSCTQEEEQDDEGNTSVDFFLAASVIVEAVTKSCLLQLHLQEEEEEEGYNSGAIIEIEGHHEAKYDEQCGVASMSKRTGRTDQLLASTTRKDCGARRDERVEPGVSLAPTSSTLSSAKKGDALQELQQQAHHCNLLPVVASSTIRERHAPSFFPTRCKDIEFDFKAEPVLDAVLNVKNIDGGAAEHQPHYRKNDSRLPLSAPHSSSTNNVMKSNALLLHEDQAILDLETTFTLRDEAMRTTQDQHDRDHALAMQLALERP